MDFIIARGVKKGINVKNARKPRKISTCWDGSV